MTSMLLAAALCFADGDAAASELTEADRQRLDFVLAGFKESREQLRTGIYRAVGTKRDGIAGNARFPAYEGVVEIYSAFDYGQELFRFERSEPSLFEDDPDLPIRKVDLQLKYVRTPELSIHAASGWLNRHPGDVVIKPPQAPPSEYLFPIDVRNLGASSWYVMSKGTPFERTFELLAMPRAAEIDEERNGVFRFTRVYGPAESLQSVYWFDANQGFSPIRFEFRESGPKGEFRPPMTLVQMTWKEIEEIWLPEVLSMVDQQAGNGRIQRYDLQFEWESVNSPLPADLFTPESLPLKRGTPIIDQRSGRSVVVGRVGDDAR